MRAPRRRGQAHTLAYETKDRAGQPVTITAAAQLLNGPKIHRTGPRKAAKNTSQPWQADAWSLYDEVGELWWGNEWLAKAVSGCRLVAAKVSTTGDDPEPITEGLPAELVGSWGGGPAHQSQILYRAGSQLALTGDSYIVGRTEQGTDGADPTDEWQAYSTEETSYSNGKWAIDDGSGKAVIGDNDLIIRCWRPHPRRFIEANCAVRPSLPVIRELRGLTMHVAAQIDSRLAGAGLLLLPNSMTFASARGAQAGDDRDGEDPFVRELIEAMVTPIRDRDSAAAVVPLVAKVPDEVLGKAQYLTFAGSLDPKARELRDEAIRRLALGLDMPPEVLLGMGDVNHWSAWQIDEGSIRLNVSPMIANICLALTVGWFQEALAAAGEPNPEDYLVWFDTSALKLRPDRSGDAKDLYDRFLVGPEAVRRETGFSDEDKPTDDELARMVLLKLIDRAPDIQALIRALGLPADVVPAALPPGSSPDTTGGGAGPGGGAGDRALPERQTSPPDGGGPDSSAASATLSAAAEPSCPPCQELLYVVHGGVLRALEVAGKRLLTRDRRARYQDVRPWLLHTQIRVDETDLDRLLEGAWSILAESLPPVMDAAAADRVMAAANEYVRDLLRSGQVHDLQWLAGALDRAEIDTIHAQHAQAPRSAAQPQPL